MLEVGPGTGYYTLDVARELGPGGTLHILDAQQRMLDHVANRASDQGGAVVATCADAQKLPYRDQTFDAAFLIAVLGEIPDQARALAELRRVLRPGGRVVVGELFGDPHMVALPALRRRAEAIGLALERQAGPRFGYFAVLRRANGR